MASLAAAYLYRVDAEAADPPRLQFGTRVMANVDPVPRNAFLPRALPATVFGPCDTVPGGYWIYQNGKVVAKRNIQTSGIPMEELNILKATWDEHETPISPEVPPEAGLFDAGDIQFADPVIGATRESATCPACIQRKDGLMITASHSIFVWGML